MRPLPRQLLLLAAIALAAGMAAFGWLLSRPAANLAAARGLFPAEEGRGGRLFQWTASRVEVPLHAGGAPARLDLLLAAEPWPGRPSTLLALSTDRGPLGSFLVAPEPRRYAVLLPPGARSLHMATNLDRPPGAVRRWVGAQLFGLTATPLGPPWGAVGLAALAGLGAAAALLLLSRLALLPGPGAAPPPLGGARLALALIVLLGGGLRLWRLGDLPPGAHHDELVSLVDAWYLLHTARDHHGHLLPIGAFEAFGDWISPLITYLHLPLVALLGPDPLAGRLLTALLGTLAIPLIYGLCRWLGLPRAAALCGALVTALSPWQISLSRTAIPPALVFVAVTLTLWAGLLLIRRGDARAAWLLALAAGVGLYAYPALKLYLPLLAAAAVLLAVFRHGWRAARAWLLPAAGLALLWLPFAWQTLFNPLSSTRFGDLAIPATSALDWLGKWLGNYLLFFQPQFYYRFGDRLADHGYLRRGVQLWPEALLVAAGLLSLLGLALRRPPAGPEGAEARARRPEWQLVLAATLLAPLPVSLTSQTLHAYRASTIAPLYVLLAALGAALLWRLAGRAASARLRAGLRSAGAALLAGLLLWQSLGWFVGYARVYPVIAVQPWVYQDGLLETLRVTAGYADEYDEVRFDRQAANIPYIYLLAALPAPLSDPQTHMEIARQVDPYNEVRRVGRFRFVDFDDLSYDLPAREVIFNRLNRPAYLVQELEERGRRVLLIRTYDKSPVRLRFSTVEGG